MSNQLRIVLLGCARSAGVAMEELMAARSELPPGFEWVCMPCGGSIDELHILRAFESGADQVVVLACYDGACHSLRGNQLAEKRAQAARDILEEAGIPGERLIFRNVSPTMAADLLQWIRELPEPRVDVAGAQVSGC